MWWELALWCFQDGCEAEEQAAQLEALCEVAFEPVEHAGHFWKLRWIKDLEYQL